MWRWSNGEGKVITTRLLKRDVRVLFKFRQDFLNDCPTPINFYRYNDHFSLTEGSATLTVLDKTLLFQTLARGLNKESLIFGRNTDSYGRLH